MISNQSKLSYTILFERRWVARFLNGRNRLSTRISGRTGTRNSNICLWLILAFHFKPWKMTDTVEWAVSNPSPFSGVRQIRRLRSWLSRWFCLLREFTERESFFLARVHITSLGSFCGWCMFFVSTLEFINYYELQNTFNILRFKPRQNLLVITLTIV